MKTALKPERVIDLISDGATILVGGFMGVGSPHRVLPALRERGTRNLTIVCNDLCTPEKGVGRLVVADQVARATVSHIGLNPVAQKMMLAGELDIELVPQGTLVERIRAGVTTTGITFTFGGLKIDERGAVIDTTDRSIPGSMRGRTRRRSVL